MKIVEHKKNQGMALPEVIVAVIMLAAFTGIFVTMTEYISKFFKLTEDYSKANKSSGLLIDQHKIRIAMDSWVDIFSQVGYSKSDLKEIVKLGCSNIPYIDWDLPGERHELPNGYQFCVGGTRFDESNILDWYDLTKKKTAKPGIYVIYAKPLKASNAALPLRRVFCRPKPYCIDTSSQ